MSRMEIEIFVQLGRWIYEESLLLRLPFGLGKKKGKFDLWCPSLEVGS